MPLVSQAEFARLHNVSRKTVTTWKKRGYLELSAGQVDVEVTNRVLASVGRFQQLSVTQPSSSLLAVTGEGNRLPEMVGALSAVVDGCASDASIVLLRHLPIATVRPLVAELLASARRGAAEILDYDGIDPPPGLTSWAEHPAFCSTVPTEEEWVEAAQLAEAGDAI